MHKTLGYGAMIYGMNGSVQGENQTHVMIPCEYWAPWCETAHVNLTDDEFDSVYLLNPSPFKTAAPYLNIFLAYDLVVHFCSHFCLHLNKSLLFKTSIRVFVVVF